MRPLPVVRIWKYQYMRFHNGGAHVCFAPNQIEITIRSSVSWTPRCIVQQRCRGITYDGISCSMHEHRVCHQHIADFHGTLGVILLLSTVFFFQSCPVRLTIHILSDLTLQSNWTFSQSSVPIFFFQCYDHTDD